MKVNSSQSSVAKTDKSKSGKSLSSPLLLLTILIVCVTTFIITIKAPNYLRTWALEHGYDALRKDVRLYQAFLQLSLRLVQSLKPSTLPKLNIDIKFKHLKKLRDKRAEALAKGILIQGPDDFVSASIRLDERTIKVKLRLKGDWTDHLEGKKWSFRVHVKRKEQIFGMRRFSIQSPKTRGFQSELLFFDTLRDVGVLVPRYFFVNVAVNGDNVGIMAVEEHFSKELLESNGRRESVIVRFDESLLWEIRVRKIRPEDDPLFNNYLNAPIDAFRSSRVARSQTLSKDYAIAVGLLRGFVNGDLQASEVFDVELMGRFLGVSEFWGSKHSIIWHNLRLYLNPISLRLEPICFDADLRAYVRRDEIICQEAPVTVDLLKDSKIFEVYQKALDIILRRTVKNIM